MVSRGAIAGILIILIFGIVVVAVMSTSGAKEPGAVSSGGAGAGADPTKSVDQNGNVLKGYTDHKLMSSDAGLFKGTSISDCRKIAKKYGYPGVGFRTSEHPDPAFKNTCFFYYGMDTGFTGVPDDNAHVTACTDASKKWPSCDLKGASLAGYTATNIVDPGFSDKASSIEVCRSNAKTAGHLGVGYRTSGHDQDVYKDTCFYYSTPDANFTGNGGDRMHVSACTDATKTWPEC